VIAARVDDDAKEVRREPPSSAVRPDVPEELQEGILRDVLGVLIARP